MPRKHPMLYLTATVLAFMTVALTIWIITSDRTEVKWQTFESKHFGYAVDYPGNWRIAVREPQPSDDFEAETVFLDNGSDSITVAANFQGGWCESGTESTKGIVVTGHDGEEFVCTIFGGSNGFKIVRFFAMAAGASNYYISASSSSRNEPSGEVLRILDSFRFTR